MKNGLLKLSLIVSLVLSASCLWAQNSFKVEAPNVVGKGERFLVKFVANGEVSNFTPPSFAGADVIAGPTTSTSWSSTIINGKRSSSYTKTYTYVLEASDQETVTVSSASAEIEGTSYTTKSLTIEIVKGSSNQQSSSQTQTQQAQPSAASSQAQTQSRSQDYDDDPGITYGKADLFLRLSLNKTKVFKGEPVTAVLKIYTRSNIVGFEDIKFPVFNGFWSQETEAPQNLNLVREKVGNQIYNSAVIRRYMLMPQKSGTLTIDPAEMVCQVEVTSRPRGRSILDDFFDMVDKDYVKKRLSTGKLTVHVSEIPSGAPSSFGGGVGKLNMTARLTKDSLNANEAASLIVELSGSGNLNLIENPVVSFPPDFERYDAKSTNNFSNSIEGYSGKKTIEYPFIPRGEGVYQIPPIHYSYFDLGQRQYRTLSTDTITVKVGKGTSQNTGGMYIPQTQKTVSNLGEDIRYIKTGLPKLNGENFLVFNWIYYVIAAILAGLFFLVTKLMKDRIALRKDVVRSRNRKANKVARQRLKQAQTFLSQNKVQEFYEELHKAILGYTADKLSIQRSDLQRDIIQETLLSKKVPQEDVRDLIALLDDCEMVRYSPEGAAGAMDAQYRKAAELISGFENKL